MKNIKTENSFIGNDITKFNNLYNKKNIFPIISKVFFKVKENETVSFVFDDIREQNSLLNIFKGDDLKFSGFFEYKNEIFFSKSKKNITDIIDVVDGDYFTQQKQKTKTISLLENHQLYNSFVKSNIKLINKHNIFVELHKNDIMYFSQKIILDTLKEINDISTHLMNNLNDLCEKISFDITEHHFNINDETSTLLNKTINKYEEYLNHKSKLLYNRNKKLVNFFLYGADNEKTKYFLSLENKLKELHKEIHSFKKKKNKNRKILDFISKIENIKTNKNVTLSKLNVKKHEFNFYRKKYKNYSIKSNNFKTRMLYLYKYYVNSFFFNFIKQNSRYIAFLNENQMKNFMSELNIQYSLIIFEFDTFLNSFEDKKNKKDLIKNKIRSIFALDIHSYRTMSKQNYEELTRTDQTNVLITNQENDLYKTNNLTNKKDLKKMEYREMYDEYQWIKSNSILIMNQEILKIKDEIKKEEEQYFFLKREINNKINILFKTKQKILKHHNHEENLKIDENNNSNKENLNNNQKIHHKYEKLCLSLEDDLDEIVYFLRNKIKKTEEKKYKIILYKYHLYKIAVLCEFDIFNLTMSYNEISNLNKAKFCLMKAIVSKKQILVFNNLLKLLSRIEKQEFIKVYKKVVEKTKRHWIQLTSNFSDIKNISNWVNIIKYSKNIEFGKIEEIKNKPIYDHTSQIVNNESLLDRKVNPIIKLDVNLIKYKYDFYKVGPNHYVYANINEIYEWTKKVPNKCFFTNIPFEIEDLKNRINAKKIINKKIKPENNYKEKEESVIIDVTKEFKI